MFLPWISIASTISGDVGGLLTATGAAGLAASPDFAAGSGLAGAAVGFDAAGAVVGLAADVLLDGAQAVSARLVIASSDAARNQWVFMCHFPPHSSTARRIPTP